MNIVLTWPKKRTLDSYLEELAKAAAQDLVINFRVASMPDVHEGELCYMVHDGFVRGYNYVIDALYREDVVDPITNLYMRPGFYVVRDPVWHPLTTPVEMQGFRGFRYADKFPQLERV